MQDPRNEEDHALEQSLHEIMDSLMLEHSQPAKATQEQPVVMNGLVAKVEIIVVDLRGGR